MTFYELIINRAMGKSGPLFQFDLQEHAMMTFDPRIKSQDSHAGARWGAKAPALLAALLQQAPRSGRPPLPPPRLPRAGKVVDRHWYDKNKHIYPASRWATFDPEKNFNQDEGDAE